MKDEQTALVSKTNEFANVIWDFIRSKYNECSPACIKVYHRVDGMVFVKCDGKIFTTIRHFSLDCKLLEILSSIVDKFPIEGKMYLHSSKDFLNILDFKFSYK